MQREHWENLDPAGVSLQSLPSPLGNYRAAIVRGTLGCVSGQFPILNGKLMYQGRVGAKVSVEEARHAMRIAAANALAQIHLRGGGISRLEGLMRIDGLIWAAGDFQEHAAVLDGASDYLINTLGETMGAHARSALSVAGLPMGSPVELVVTFLQRSSALE